MMPTPASAAPGRRTPLVGWGGTRPTVAEVVALTSGAVAEQTLRHPGRRGVIARGLGRSYGDAALNAGGTVLDATALDTPGPTVGPDGTVRVPAGLSLDALLRTVVPAGWFVPVTPGTRFVTIGGAIAADVHGKNHHRDGSIGAHIRRLTLATPTGTVEIGPDRDPELFWATVGGMGLTGVILEADLVLPAIETAHLRVDTVRTGDLDEVMALMTEGDHRYHYSVAWIDCVIRGRHLGRSVLTRGDFARRSELSSRCAERPLDYRAAVRLTAPPVFPSGLVNHRTMRAFNEAVYRRAPAHREGELQTIARFFHPLDVIGSWNRLYGRRGFLQWQVVLPFGAEDVLRRSIEGLAAAGAASSLAVLKRFGPGDPAPLSFPTEGWTLALDLAVAPELTALLDGLDDAVVKAGGRVYLAKDSRVRRELVGVMYPRLDEWRAVRRRVDPDGVLISDLDRRLDLTGRTPAPNGRSARS